jgi:hypothetical protein
VDGRRDREYAAGAGGFFAGLKAGAPAMPVFDKETVSLEGAVWRAEQLAQRVSAGVTAVSAD